MGGINRDIGLADPISGRVQHGSMGIFQVFIRSKEKMLLVFRHIYIYIRICTRMWTVDRIPHSSLHPPPHSGMTRTLCEQQSVWHVGHDWLATVQG